MEKEKAAGKITAKFKRHKGAQNPYIEVQLPNGIVKSLYRTAVSMTASDLTPNERKTVIAQLEKEIDSFETGDCPTAFRELLRELKDYGGMRK